MSLSLMDMSMAQVAIDREKAKCIAAEGLWRGGKCITRAILLDEIKRDPHQLILETVILNGLQNGLTFDQTEKQLLGALAKLRLVYGHSKPKTRPRAAVTSSSSAGPGRYDFADLEYLFD